MKKDKEVTKVIFRVDTTKDFKGIVFALFPYDIENFEGHVNSYQHVGQHSSADYDHCIKNSKPATIEEAKDLKCELESIGYNLKVVSRQSYRAYHNAYQKMYFKNYVK